MNPLSARKGMEWIRDGILLFRKRPFFLTNLFFMYVMAIVILSVVPVVGQFLPVLVSPIFTMLFMQACASIDSEEPSSFRDLFRVLTRSALSKLVMAGVLYLLFAMFAAGVSYLIDGGSLFTLLGQQNLDEFSDVQKNNMMISFAVIMLSYIPFAMAMWFVVPLCGWQDMNIGKALFYSFFTVARSYRPFLMYIICWFLLGGVLPFVLTGAIAMLAGQSVAGFIVMTLSFILTVWMYCSFYPTYRDIFGRPVSNFSPWRN